MRRTVSAASAALVSAAAVAAAAAGCSDGEITASEAEPRPAAVAASRAVGPADTTARARAAGPQPVSFVGEPLRVSHDRITFEVTGDLVGANPAGAGLYLERPADVGNFPVALNFRQGEDNLWGVGMDQDTGDPYPDFVAVFQRSAGDVFRFREGGRAVLGNGVDRPAAEHVLTLQDRQNAYIENILNLQRQSTGNSVRYLRAFDGVGVPFAVGPGGRTGVGGDYSPAHTLDVNGRARARSYVQIEEPTLATDIEEVLGVLDDVRSLVPLRYRMADGSDRSPRYGLIDVANQDALFPETVSRDGPGNLRAVDYAQVTALLVAAVKELALEVDRLEQQVGAGSPGGVGATFPCPPPRRERRGGTAPESADASRL